MSEKSALKPFGPSEIAVFCTQIAYILKAGVPLYEGTSLLCEDLEDSRIKDAVLIIDDEIKKNAPFHKALEATGMFPSYMLNMVHIGEMSGKLDDVMDSLALYYEREQSLKNRIRSAVTYPILLFVMMSVVVMILVVKVLPMFDQVFKELGGEMSSTATAIMNFGLSAGKYMMVLVGVLVVVLLLCAIWSRTASGKRAFSRFFAAFGPTKKITRKVAAGRFASAMALMLSSGLDMDEALKAASDVIDNDYLRNKVLDCCTSVDSGKPFTQALQDTGIFPNLFTRMINIGFKTGSTDTVMKKLADIYDDEIDTSLGNATSLIEPILVAVLSIVVGIILISVMLPLVGIMSSIG